MEHNINKDKWIDEVLNSTWGMSRAQPVAGLFEQITAKLSEPQTIKMIAFPVKQWVAAAIVLLALNVGSVIYFAQNKGGVTNSKENPLAMEIQSASTYNY